MIDRPPLSRSQPKLSQSLDEVLSTLLPSSSSSSGSRLDGNCLPIWTTLPADILTPVVAYLRLTDGARGVESFLFESAVKGETAGRWSFVGASTLHPHLPYMTSQLLCWNDIRMRSRADRPVARRPEGDLQDRSE